MPHGHKKGIRTHYKEARQGSTSQEWKWLGLLAFDFVQKASTGPKCIYIIHLKNRTLLGSKKDQFKFEVWQRRKKGSLNF